MWMIKEMFKIKEEERVRKDQEHESAMAKIAEATRDVDKEQSQEHLAELYHMARQQTH